ncbi:hypothetical protein [Rhodoferax ferrireducens]|uniref:hypothetical protein n=1 Tax=Rhodoferax ferrireducens TaxID=192843 RepID=UPI000E0CFEB1|nr:hypothetical protein [Rhodoferax ferrireducens]
MAYIHVHVELDEFSESELIQEMKSRGFSCVKTGASCEHESITSADFERIEHLVICGQTSAARSEVLHLVGNVIGRDLTH